MYGRMQFADYIVSTALQSLTRSLLRLREQDVGMPDCDARLLDQQAEQLLSLWQMMQWSVGKLQYDSARRDLREIVALCQSGDIAQVRGARQLLQVSATDESESSQVETRPLEEFIAVFSVPKNVDAHVTRDRISSLLQTESARWREYRPLRGVSDDALIEHGLIRAFERSSILSDKLNPEGGDREPPSVKRLQRGQRWVRHCANHLELLRPALSEAGRTRRWHLTRLAAKLEDQLELETFAQAVKQWTHNSKLAARFDKVVRRQRKRLAKQRSKLATGAFIGGVEGYRLEVTEAVNQLGLKEITLLPLEGRMASDRDGS